MPAPDSKEEGTWAAIQRVRVRWDAGHSRVAKGGANALLGFEYQFLVALRDTVRRWLNDQSRNSEPKVFTEILSDVIAVAANGPVHVTQVKRTQSGAAVRAALDDLWVIHKLLFASEPILFSVIGYRIVSARPKVADVTSVVSEWTPSDVVENDTALQDFKLRLHVEIDADPESELLTVLANECRADEPLALVHRWLGRLVHAPSTPDGFVSAGREIWNDLVALSATSEHKRARSAIYLWQEGDQPPESVSRGPYLTGERPTPRHLRLGFFARRENIIEPLSKKLLEWLIPHPASADASLRLPVFWIGGRSGTGKSVALLDVLSRIRGEQIGPVLWLGPHIAALADAIRWGQKLRRPGETLIIGLDDPYAPAVQNEAIAVWQQAISEMTTVRQGDDPMNLPVLICCGPTEQAERLERELSDDVRLTREDLPHEDSTDRGTLRDWFRQRTGMEPPEMGDGDVLLVQLFFEWKVGATLPEFAHRLRLRIEAAEATYSAGELITQFSRILALNRLYVGFPSGALEAKLTPAQKSVFLRLQLDNHLAADPDDQRPGIWLAHPHLSNAIYAAWYSGSADQPIRTDHLREGILSAIEYGESPSRQQSPLWAISRALDSTLGDSNVADRFDDEQLPSLLQDIHQTLIKRYAGKLPQTHLPVWIEIRSLRVSLELHPDPIEAGIAALQAATPETGLRLTVHKLLQYLPRHHERVRTRIIEATIHLLKNTTEWHEWIPIMLDALRRCQRPELGSMVASWAEDNPDHPIVPVLLKAALEHATGEEIRNVTARLTATAGEGVAWGNVALMLLGEGVSPIPDEIVTWAERHRSTFGVCWVLGRLLTLRYELAASWAIEWAQRFHLERNANWVLEPLILSGEQTADVAEWAEAWARLDYPNAGRVIQLLVEGQPDRAFIRELAIDWLRRNPSDGSWGYAWEGLWKVCHGDSELVTRGTRWLEASLGHGSWPFLWLELNKATPGDVQLRDLGLRWLETTPLNHWLWPKVWLALDKTTAGDVQLSGVGLRWLETASLDHPTWSFVWLALNTATPGDAQLRDLGLRWLATTSPARKAWRHLWTALDTTNPGDEQLRDLWVRWLATAALEDGSWPFLWIAADKATPGDAQLRDIGMRWLATTSQHNHVLWGDVWRTLDTAIPEDPQLRELGFCWLDVAMKHRRWAFVWLALDQATPGHPQLRELAIRWLNVAPMKRGSWSLVWLTLWKRSPRNEELAELGHRFLRKTTESHLRRSQIESALGVGSSGGHTMSLVPPSPLPWINAWEKGGDRAMLLKDGMEWLQTSITHMLWASVFIRLWRARERPATMAELGARWLEANPNGRRADEVRRLLLSAASHFSAASH